MDAGSFLFSFPHKKLFFLSDDLHLIEKGYVENMPVDYKEGRKEKELAVCSRLHLYDIAIEV
jgi:hypothetical protein